MVARGSAIGIRGSTMALAAALWGADVPFDPEIDAHTSATGFLLSDAIETHARIDCSVVLPVWFRGTRLVRSPSEGKPGFACFYPEISEHVDFSFGEGERFFHQFEHFERRLPSVVRVLDARDGATVFTSALPPSVLANARRVVQESPRGRAVVSTRPTHRACAVPEIHWFRIYHALPWPPALSYFNGKNVQSSYAVVYRNFLRDYQHFAVLAQELNPDFLDWFYQQVEHLPEPPLVDQVCSISPPPWTEPTFENRDIFPFKNKNY